MIYVYIIIQYTKASNQHTKASNQNSKASNQLPHFHLQLFEWDPEFEGAHIEIKNRPGNWMLT